MATPLHDKRYAQQPGVYRNNLCTEDSIPGSSGFGIRRDDATNVSPLEKPGLSPDE